MKDKIKQYNKEQVELRQAEIAVELDGDLDLETLETLEEETELLEERSKEIKQAVEKRSEILKRVANTDSAKVIESRKEEENMTKTLTRDSKEYRSAYFKGLIGEDMTVEERAAFTEITTTFKGALPREVEREIISLVEEEYAILHDIDATQIPGIRDINIHQKIVSGDAAQVTEGVGNEGLKNEWGTFELKGLPFSDNVTLSIDLSTMNGNDLDGYLQEVLAERIGVALNKHVIAKIDEDMDENNKFEVKGKLKYSDILAAFASIRGKKLAVYVNNKDLYMQLASLTDEAGHLIFQSDAKEGVQGRLLGYPVKVDETVEGVYIGAPKMVKANFGVPMKMLTQVNAITAGTTYALHTRFEAKLSDPRAFAKITVTAGGISSRSIEHKPKPEELVNEKELETKQNVKTSAKSKKEEA